MDEGIIGAHVVFHRMIDAPYDKCGEQNAVEVVLLCKRTQDAPVHPGCWGLFGGKANDRETPLETAQREVKEELEGIGGCWRHLEPLTAVSVSRRKGTFRIQYFQASLKRDMDGLKLKRNAEHGEVEGEGLAWFTEEEVHHLRMPPEDRTAVMEFFQSSGQHAC